jgi:hypothetical protein
MKTLDARKIAAAIGILAASLTFQAQAFAASGRVNIQTVPEGARYLIVTSKDLKMVHGGISPYFDAAFPTGKYKVCFELDGYVTVWQDSVVATFGSSWVGPVMERSTSATRSSCEDDVTRMKTALRTIKSSLSSTIKQIERTAAPAGTSQDGQPAVAPAAPTSVDHDHDYTNDRQRASEIRDRVQDKRRVP